MNSSLDSPGGHWRGAICLAVGAICLAVECTTASRHSGVCGCGSPRRTGSHLGPCTHDMACRRCAGSELTGTLLTNNKPRDVNKFKRLSAYVLQVSRSST